MQAFFKTFTVMLPAALACALLAACGGKVVVDVGGDGSGGTGSSVSTTGTLTTTVTSTSSGLPVCSCDQFCSIMLDCGYSTKDCVDFACAQIPLDTQQCVCNEAPLVGCGFLDSCFGSAGTGGGTGGGGASDECLKCAEQESIGKCTYEFMSCQANPDCQSLLDCNLGCNFTDACITECFAKTPYGQLDFTSLAHCAFCSSCWELCQDSAVMTFCEAPPPP